MEKPFVRFGYADRKLSLKNKRLVQDFLVGLVSDETHLPCRLLYVFCSDAYLHKINVSFLAHDDYTDIITFDLSGDRSRLIEGEIYISVDRVIANAVDLRVSFQQEILRVIFHGALHLCGYGDKTERTRKQMRSREDFYLNKFGA